MTEAEKREHRCCFTGHRPQKLNKPEFLIKMQLEHKIKDAIKDGYNVFITGMAYGIDLWAGEIIVKLRKRNPDLRLIAAVPFPGFKERWSDNWKAQYSALLAEADLVRTISDYYHGGAYQKRNEWMVDHSSKVIAVFNGEASGTKNTIDYAAKCGVSVTTIKA